MIGIKLISLVNDQPTEHDGRWLQEYDPTRGGIDPDGVRWCHLVTTADPDHAMKFEDVAAAFQTYQLSNGVRQDGHPDRPLTAFSVTVEELK